MLQSYLNGFLLTASLIVALGAQNAFVLAQSLRREHHLASALLCIVCDFLLISAGVLGLAQLISKSPELLAIARFGGAAFLFWYGFNALKRAAKPNALIAASQASQSLSKVLLLTLSVTLLNPHVYIDTVLLIGSVGAQQGVPYAFILGATSVSTLWFMSLALGASHLAPRLAKPMTWRVIDCAIGLLMFALASSLLLKPF